MSEMLPTLGGRVTRAEVYTKLLHHLREAQSLAATMAHLHRTEDSKMDEVLAHGWLGISELLNRFCKQVTDLAAAKLLKH
ncbi:MAG: hypothetical protein E6Q97_34800 [Desulfurellales bacterium]|nr:MAG: hypothetical protein E6Q97_34800 [Desulfurellales bacterium]